MATAAVADVVETSTQVSIVTSFVRFSIELQAYLKLNEAFKTLLATLHADQGCNEWSDEDKMRTEL